MRPLAVACLIALAGCPLPGNVLYRCEGDGGCAIKDTECRADGYCHPVEQPEDDGGMPCDRSIDLAARCRESLVECGYVRNGCGEELFCGKWCPAQQQCGVHAANRCAYPSLCTSDGWCWENPLPQGYGLSGSFALDEHHVWFVGDNETIVFFDGEKLSLQASPTPNNRQSLLDVHAAAPDDAVAGGRLGTLLHWDGQQWEREGSEPRFGNTVRAVWALGQGAALAAGTGGTLLIRRPGSAADVRWKAVTLPTANEVRALYVSGDGVAFALTDPAGLFASAPGDYETWAAVPVSPLPAGRRIAAAHDALYLGGNLSNGATLGRLDPDGGYEVITSVTGAVTGLFTSDADLWVLTAGGGLALLSDAGVLAPTITNGPWQTGVWLRQGRPLLAGTAGAMGLVTPTGMLLSWSPQVAPAAMNLGAVCGISPGVMYAVGAREGQGCGPGTAMGTSDNCVRFATRLESSLGVSWEWYRSGLGGTTQLLACYMLDERRLWFTGDDSKFFYWTTSSPTTWGWGDFTGSFGGQYTGAWGLADAGFYFARQGAPELTTSPTGANGSFSALNVGSATNLRGVWGTGGDHVVAVGASGSVSRFDGTSWANAANVANADLLAVHGALLTDGGRRYVVGGTNGVLLSGDGELPWLPATATAQRFNQVWVSTSGVAWAAGVALDGGAWVERSEAGGAWASVPLVSPRGLTGLYGFDHADGGHTVWVTGTQGLILRRP